jgi:phosphoenolpyruvate synthase/pyruvate phosphate dikinase
MIIAQADTKLKKINYRSVNTMVAAEFLHELYNRHYPNINSIRFRNTLVEVRGTEVNTYAPQQEWDQLAKWFGERFLRGQAHVYKHLDDLINYQKPVLAEMIERLKQVDFTAIDDIELMLHLIDLQNITVGEIYRVNLVQVEHALNYAIYTGLKQHGFNDEEANAVVSYLVASEEKTHAIQEEEEFMQLVLQTLPQFNQAQTITSEVGELIKQHADKYAFTHSAYGANAYSVDDYNQKYLDLANAGAEYIAGKLKDIADSRENIVEKKAHYRQLIAADTVLLQNIAYSTKIGELRDRNKALMGSTNVWREQVLAEITKRKQIDMQELRWYLLSEIGRLLADNERVSPAEIAKRAKGFRLVRKEYLEYLDESDNQHKQEEITTLQGTCASSGNAVGTVRIIKSSNDIHKMQIGDIMVSPGTDFDLINAMQIAGAIITEEGGILSHASVVSRELGIPCVIGVENATQLLVEGSQVEVDATAGTIKLINS